MPDQTNNERLSAHVATDTAAWARDAVRALQSQRPPEGWPGTHFTLSSLVEWCLLQGLPQLEKTHGQFPQGDPGQGLARGRRVRHG